MDELDPNIEKAIDDLVEPADWKAQPNYYQDTRERDIPLIARSAMSSYQFARYVRKEPFVDGEPAIAKDLQYAKRYIAAFPERADALRALGANVNV